MVGTNVNILFQNALKIIEEELSSLSFSTWFDEVKLIELKDGIATFQFIKNS